MEICKDCKHWPQDDACYFCKITHYSPKSESDPKVSLC